MCMMRGVREGGGKEGNMVLEIGCDCDGRDGSCPAHARGAHVSCQNTFFSPRLHGFFLSVALLLPITSTSCAVPVSRPFHSITAFLYQTFSCRASEPFSDSWAWAASRGHSSSEDITRYFQGFVKWRPPYRTRSFRGLVATVGPHRVCSPILQNRFSPELLHLVV